MSVANSSGRDPKTNAGSDSGHRFNTSVAEAFNRAAATPKTTEQGTPTVRNLPVGASDVGAIKNR